MSEWKKDCDVLIVGAGPVGLALATELTMRGHTVRVMEKNERVGVQPRAKTTNVRTMTQMRRWGLAEEMRRRSPLRADFPRDVRFATSLFGHDIFTFKNAFCASPERDDRFPENAEFIPQYVVEGILLDHVKAHPLAKVTFQNKLESFEQDENGVTAQFTDLQTGETHQVNATYMVGADGGRSTVRDRLGYEMQGDRNLVSFVTLILRIPGLSADPDLKEALFHWIIDPEAPSFLGPMDTDDRWFWAMVVAPDAPNDNETLLKYVRAGIKKPYDIEVLARDEWTVNRLVADHYRKDRVLLAGDACHLHSPFGGHGMNQGVGDAVDLGWKLSAVLQGWGADGLLDSYEVERKQVHEAVIKSSTENVATLSDHFADPALLDDGEKGAEARKIVGAAVESTKAPEFRSLGLVLGYRYEASPIVVQEPEPTPPLVVTNYTPTARPGFLAPHAWISQDKSLYDLFGTGFTLVRMANENAVMEAEMKNTAEKAGLPLTIIAPENPDIAKLYGADYALVRPDQHVAWRGNKLEDCAALIELVRGA